VHFCSSIFHVSESITSSSSWRTVQGKKVKQSHSRYWLQYVNCIMMCILWQFCLMTD
jgi:ABC-type Fe3+ transport system permease subunit